MSIIENVNGELGGAALFITISNKEIAGYGTSGDLENAGDIEKSFKRSEDGGRDRASIRGEDD